MRTCIAAIDFSEITREVVELAGVIAAAGNGRLMLLHVLELPPLRDAKSLFVVHSGTMDPPDLKRSKQQLEKIAGPLRSRGLKVDTLVAAGSPPEEILHLARSTNACMILLGSRGHGMISQALTGSVVTSVLKESKIPVTVVPLHAREAPR